MYPSPLEEVFPDWLKGTGVRLFLKRDDLLHPLVSGNKFRKLKYNILEAQKQGIGTILSFGGAYSNHIQALAAACEIHQLKSIGIIRGEETLPLNPTLEFAMNAGMQIEYVPRSDYRQKSTPEFIQALKQKYGDFYLVPEGGTNQLAIQGTAEIIPEIAQGFDYICSPVGTGGTVAGLIKSCPDEAIVLGFSALKGDFLKAEVEQLLGTQYSNWEMVNAYHFGGYAKVKPELIDFLADFKRQTQVQLEPIYNGKMMFGIKEMLYSGVFKAGQTIIALHTGGLQGLAGFGL